MVVYPPPVGRGALNSHFQHTQHATSALDSSGALPVMASSPRPACGDASAGQLDRVQLLSSLRRLINILHRGVPGVALANAACLPSLAPSCGAAMDRVILSRGGGQDNQAFVTVTGRSRPTATGARLRSARRRRASAGAGQVGAPPSSYTNADRLAESLQSQLPTSVGATFVARSGREDGATARASCEVDLAQFVFGRLGAGDDVGGGGSPLGNNTSAPHWTRVFAGAPSGRKGSVRECGGGGGAQKSNGTPNAGADSEDGTAPCVRSATVTSDVQGLFADEANRRRSGGLIEGLMEGIAGAFERYPANGRASLCLRQVRGHDLRVDGSVNSLYQNLFKPSGYELLPYMMSVSFGNRPRSGYSGGGSSGRGGSGRKLSLLNYRVGCTSMARHAADVAAERPLESSDNNNSINNNMETSERPRYVFENQWQAGASLEHQVTLIGSRGSSTNNGVSKAGTSTQQLPVCGSQHVTVGGSIGYLARSAPESSSGVSSSSRPPHHRNDARAGGATQIGDIVHVHPFLSAGLNCQLGKLMRPFLSYASFSLRLDDGPSYDNGGGDPPLQPRMKRRQTISSSLSAQLLGLSRIRLHATLEPLSGSRRADKHVAARTRPVLFFGGDGGDGDVTAGSGAKKLNVGLPPLVVHDVGIGVDVLPRSAGGALRVLAWFAPLRKEAMIELRLWEQ